MNTVYFSNFKILIILILFNMVHGGVIKYPYQAYYDNRLLTFYERSVGTERDNFIMSKILALSENETDLSYDEKCIIHLQVFRTAVAKSEMWALQMMDSSGYILPGFLLGDVVNLGSYDECLMTDVTFFKPSYCMALIQFENSVLQKSSFVPHNAPLVQALCVPSECTSKDLNNIVEPLSKKYNLSIDIKCIPSEQKFTMTEIFSMLFFIIFTVIITGSTIYDMYHINAGSDDFFRSFSILANVKNLMRTTSNKDTLSSLHGIRFLSQFCVIWYHYFLNVIGELNPVVNKFMFNDFVRSWKGTFIVTLTLAVDTYFVLSGLLLSYNFIKRGQNKVSLYNYFHRYLRITPALIAVVILYSSFAEKLCNGPLCEKVVGNEHLNCKRYWWSTLLYINNFYPGMTNMCLPHSWYLSVDWQLFCISTLILNGLKKWPKMFLLQISVLLLIPIISSFSITYIFDLPTDTVLYRTFEEYDLFYFYYYTQPLTRCGPWLIGLYLGTLLKSFNASTVSMKKPTRVMFWALSLFCMVSCIAVNIPLQQPGFEHNKLVAAIYNSFQKNIWAVSVSWVIFACHVGWGGPVNTFLSWSAFQPLGKLSYSAYIVHKLIISLKFGSTRSPMNFSFIEQVINIAGTVVLSYFSALLLYIMFEVSFGNLYNHFFNKGRNNKCEDIEVKQLAQVKNND